MPELPEVETVRRRLAKDLSGKTIASVKVFNGNLRIKIPRNMPRLMANQSIEKVERRAKYLKVLLGNGYTWLTHLGMSGRMFYDGGLQKPQKHTCYRIYFKDGSSLLHNDIRRFGLALVDLESNLKQLNNLGVEPLEGDFTSASLFKFATKSTRQIKTLIMDQKVVVGVGNIYANESLFKARINPVRVSATLTKKELARLVRQIKVVLHEAINEGGSSISDFLDTDGSKGSYQDHFLVYNKEGHPCVRCKNPVIKMTQGGRSSFYCSQCQPESS